VPTICEPSSLVIPNDDGYAPLAGRYAADIATQFDFPASDTVAIGSAVESAVNALLAYSFEPAEKGRISIEFERIAEGLRIRLRDKGLPFNMDGHRSNARSTAGEFPLEPLETLLDEVCLKNRGRQGKEVILVKYLTSGSVHAYFDACLLQPFEDPAAEQTRHDSPAPYQVRQLQPGEAAEVSKIIYKTYGYNYPADYVYYPEKIAAMNESGRIHSAVAVLPDKRPVGHCALQFQPGTPRIAELGQGAVAPDYRGRGCLKKLTRYLVNVARRRSVSGIYSQTVTLHTHSQHAALQCGFKDCGLLLGLVPVGTAFRGFGGPPEERGAMLLQFLNLDIPPARKIYLPGRHHRMAARIYNTLESQPEMAGQSSEMPADAGNPSRYDIDIHSGLSYAVIQLNRSGKDAVARLSAELKKLCRKKIDIIHLRLPLGDPVTPSIASGLERVGFFFAGILPGALPPSDALILQYLNNVAVDYGKINTVSEIGRALLAYVREEDPNREPVHS
jgi:serine/threonine-protein kinase RsbW